jgi:tRNA pseudouridine55 synthase
MDRVLLIDKDKDWTSFDVVARVRSLVRAVVAADTLKGEKPKKIKVGHAGTLDPLATGLLIVLIGAATKRQDEFMKQDKEYEVEALLGEVSTTGDAEGEKTHISSDKPSSEDINRVLKQFTGTLQQVPPQYSAIKINGKRAYALARAGKQVKLEPRTVIIHSISDITYAYPKLRFKAVVSSGTYIRSLVSDIGDTLGTGAYMSNLRRTKIGSYRIDDAIKVQEVERHLLQTDD